MNVTGGIITLWTAYRRVSTIQSIIQETKDPTFMKMLNFGIKGLVGELLPLESFRLDQLMAGLLLTPSALGIYVIAQAFTNLPRFVAQSVGMIAYPAIGECQNKSSAKNTLWNFLWTTSAFNCAVVLFLIICIPYLIPLFFCNDYSASIPLARILLLSSLFSSCRRVISEGMRGFGKPEISTWAELIIYPLFTILGLFLASFYGLTGLAIAVSSCQLIALLISAKLSLKTLREKEYIL